MKLLIDTGADVNLTTGLTTALHFAAFIGFYEGVVVLIQHGANVELLDNMGRTPLQYLASKYKYKIQMTQSETKVYKLLEKVTYNLPSLLLACQISIRKHKIDVHKLPDVFMELS